MQESVVIELDESDLSWIREGDSREKASHVQEIFEHLSEAETAQLLSGFCEGLRESYNADPYVMDVSFEDSGAGTVTVDFTGSALFGCKDMDHLYEHLVTVSFSVDLETSTICFSSEPPDPPERYPDEEF